MFDSQAFPRLNSNWAYLPTAPSWGTSVVRYRFLGLARMLGPIPAVQHIKFLPGKVYIKSAIHTFHLVSGGNQTFVKKQIDRITIQDHRIVISRRTSDERTSGILK
mgnify:CR=1 FL=1